MTLEQHIAGGEHGPCLCLLYMGGGPRPPMGLQTSPHSGMAVLLIQSALTTVTLIQSFLWVSGDFRRHVHLMGVGKLKGVDKYLLIESESGNLRPLVGLMNINRFMKED